MGRPAGLVGGVCVTLDVGVVSSSRILDIGITKREKKKRKEDTILYSRKDERNHNPKRKTLEVLRNLRIGVYRFAKGMKRKCWGWGWLRGESGILWLLAQSKSGWTDRRVEGFMYVFMYF